MRILILLPPILCLFSQVSLGQDSLSNCYSEDFSLPQSTITREFRPIECEKENGLTSIYLYGEQHSGQPASLAAKKSYVSSAKNGAVFGFFEGISYARSLNNSQIESRFFGLEGPLRDLSNLSSFVSDSRLAISLIGRENPYSEVFTFERILLESLDAFRHWPDIWSDIALQKLTADRGYLPIFALLDNWISLNSEKFLDYEESNQFVDDNKVFILENYHDYISVIEAFQIELAIFLTTKPLYQDFDPLFLISNSLWLREIEWLQVIKQKLCQSQTERKDIWVQIGEGHRDRLACSLKRLLPNANIKTPTYFEVEKRFDSWKTQAREHLSTKNLSDFLLSSLSYEITRNREFMGANQLPAMNEFLMTSASFEFGTHKNLTSQRNQIRSELNRFLQGTNISLLDEANTKDDPDNGIQVFIFGPTNLMDEKLTFGQWLRNQF